MAINKIIRGPDLLCYINGNLIGEFTDLSYSIDYGRKAIFAIDSLSPYEIAPGPVKVSGKIDLLRIRGSGGLEGRGLVARISQLTKEKYVNLTIIDKVLDLEILKVTKAQVITQQWSVSAKKQMVGSFTFEGITAENEFEHLFG